MREVFDSMSMTYFLEIPTTNAYCMCWEKPPIDVGPILFHEAFTVTLIKLYNCLSPLTIVYIVSFTRAGVHFDDLFAALLVYGSLQWLIHTQTMSSYYATNVYLQIKLCMHKLTT